MMIFRAVYDSDRYGRSPMTACKDFQISSEADKGHGCIISTNIVSQAGIHVAAQAHREPWANEISCLYDSTESRGPADRYSSSRFQESQKLRRTNIPRRRYVSISAFWKELLAARYHALASAGRMSGGSARGASATDHGFRGRWLETDAAREFPSCP